MKIFNSHGSKERLFEMMKRVSNLNEVLLPIEEKNEIIDEFVKYVSIKLNLDEIPKVNISHNDDDAEKMKSFGRFVPQTNEITVIGVNRNLADVLRTLAHEMVHYKQNKEGKLNQNSGETGSVEENEANALGGVLMREFGKMHPEIFE